MCSCKYLLLGTTNPVLRHTANAAGAVASINLPPTGLRDDRKRLFRRAPTGKPGGLASPR
jgi:hypothetical protein